LPSASNNLITAGSSVAAGCAGAGLLIALYCALICSVRETFYVAIADL
jgi:hypothetical protein